MNSRKFIACAQHGSPAQAARFRKIYWRLHKKSVSLGLVRASALCAPYLYERRCDGNLDLLNSLMASRFGSRCHDSVASSMDLHLERGDTDIAIEPTRRGGAASRVLQETQTPDRR
jgi:hypothetical protein